MSEKRLELILRGGYVKQPNFNQRKHKKLNIFNEQKPQFL